MENSVPLAMAIWLHAVDAKGRTVAYNVLLRTCGVVGLVVGCLGVFAVGKILVSLGNKKQQDEHDA